MFVMGDALDVMQFNALPRNSRSRLRLAIRFTLANFAASGVIEFAPRSATRIRVLHQTFH